MAKKILIISSTPRDGGNSEILCQQFQKGADEAGHQTELIYLNQKQVGYCTGCYACNKNQGVCAKKDDMAEILAKMIEADVLVLATPVYFYTMCAQMKALIDRTVARYTELTNKELYYILAAADTNKEDMEWTVESFRAFAYCLNGSQEKGVIYGTGAWQVGEIKTTPAMNEAYEMGKMA